MIEGSLTDKQRFSAACKAASTPGQMSGIGTLGERTLHMVIKRYLEPDESLHEIKIHGFVADIANPDGITEIQTRDFSRLRKRLTVFLEHGPVTVVYPVATVKQLSWIDMETGEVGPARRSPKRGAFCDVLPELYKIRQLAAHPNFRLRVLLLELDELRYQNGWGRGGKRGSVRCDRIPTELVDDVCFSRPEDFRKMLPDGLQTPFFVKDFKNAARLSLYQAGLAVSALRHLGAIRVTSKRGNAFIYE